MLINSTGIFWKLSVFVENLSMKYVYAFVIGFNLNLVLYFLASLFSCGN